MATKIVLLMPVIINYEVVCNHLKLFILKIYHIKKSFKYPGIFSFVFVSNVYICVRTYVGRLGNDGKTIGK